MDIRINLLPREIQARWEQERQKRMLMLAGGIIIAVIAAINLTLLGSTMLVRSNLAEAREERAALEKQAAILKPYQEMRTRAAATENLLQEILGIPPNWNLIMTDIGLHIPATVRLTSFSAEYKPPAPKPAENGAENKAQAEPAGQTGELIIKGETFDHNSVANWLEEISTMPGINNVRCQLSSREGANTRSVIRFEIKASLSAPEGNSSAAEKKAGE